MEWHVSWLFKEPFIKKITFYSFYLFLQSNEGTGKAGKKSIDK